MPSKEQALQFALMLQSGIPAQDALRYFFPESQADLREMARAWLGSSAVRSAILALQGQPWQEMSLEERVKFALDKVYAEMAYYLYSHNYSELQGQDKAKADTCRLALEAKVAGTSGSDPLTKFWDDLRKGKLGSGGTSAGATHSLPA